MGIELRAWKCNEVVAQCARGPAMHRPGECSDVRCSLEECHAGQRAHRHGVRERDPLTRARQPRGKRYTMSFRGHRCSDASSLKAGRRAGKRPARSSAERRGCLVTAFDALSFHDKIMLLAATAALIGVAGWRLSGVTGRIANRTRLGHAVAGAVFLGATTSLPGSVSSTTAAAGGHP